MDKVKFSSGNIKVGKTPSVSLPPIKTCGKNVPCKKDCYVLRNMTHYPNVLKSYEHNYRIWTNSSQDYFNQIIDFCRSRRRNVKYFRYHVGGDIPDQQYYDLMVMTATVCPNTKFLAYTKRYDLNFGTPPDNLSIVISTWPGWNLPPKECADLPWSYVQDNTEDRVMNAITCPGLCESCRVCWDLKRLGKNVEFHYH